MEMITGNAPPESYLLGFHNQSEKLCGGMLFLGSPVTQFKGHNRTPEDARFPSY
ncbi:MAG: hypothetical protein V3U52_08220 [Thermoplasmata archaeon]